MRPIHHLALFIMFLFVFSTTACNSDTEQNNPPAADQGMRTEDKKKEESAQLETEKWNAYADLSNALSDNFFAAMEGYSTLFGSGEKISQTADNHTQVKWRENLSRGGTALTKAFDTAEVLAVKAPQSELDTRVATFIQVANPLWKDMKALASYTREKEYMDDSWARGNELHPRILAGLKAFDPVFIAYREAMSVKSAELRASEIQRMKKEGMKILPAMLETLFLAENIQFYLASKDATSENILTVVREDEFRPLYTAFSESLKALEPLLDAETAKREGISFHFSKVFLKDGKEYKKNAATTLEILQSKKKPHFSSFNGSPKELSRLYGRLVDRYNSALH